MFTDGQATFEGKTKAEVAIERIQMFAPREGYWLAFSGGKDSITLYDLAQRANVPFDAHYQVTGIDPPELVQFIREHYPDVRWERPPKSIFRLVETEGLPLRQARWCCKLLKEQSAHYRIVLTGIRWAESIRRKRRKLVEHCYWDKSKTYVNPIIDWTDSEVWAYIKGTGLPYCKLYDEGFQRLGCVLCPMAPPWQRKRDAERWPKLAAAWRSAAARYWKRGTKGAKRFASSDAFFEWWISGSSLPDAAQLSMFEN